MFTLPRPADDQLRVGTHDNVTSALTGPTLQFRRTTPVQGVRGGNMAAVVPHTPKSLQFSGVDFAVLATFYSYQTPTLTVVERLDGYQPRKLVLYTTDKYSVTTTQHTNRAYYAAQRPTLGYGPLHKPLGVPIPITYRPTDWLKALQDQAKDELGKALRAREKAPWRWRTYQRTLSDVTRLAAFFNLPDPFATPDTLPHATLSPKDSARLVALRLSGALELR